jgi:hypothetical protein
VGDRYQHKLGRAAVMATVLVRLFDADPVLTRAVVHVAGIAHGILDRIVTAEEEACVATARHGQERLGLDISCARYFGTGPHHKCHLLQADAVREAIEGLAGAIPTTVESLADLIRRPLIEAYRRTPTGELTWQRWGDRAFDDTVNHVARTLDGEFVEGASDLREAMRRWVANEEQRERGSHRVGRLSPWAYHLLLEAWTSTQMICAIFQPDMASEVRNRTASEDKYARRAHRSLMAIPHEVEALLARRRYAAGERCIRVSAGAAEAAVMAIGWDGAKVMARGQGPDREICPADGGA